QASELAPYRAAEGLRKLHSTVGTHQANATFISRMIVHDFGNGTKLDVTIERIRTDDQGTAISFPVSLPLELQCLFIMAPPPSPAVSRSAFFHPPPAPG